MTCESEPEVGTTFRIYLPVGRAQDSADETAVTRPTGPGAQKALLIIDDEEIVRVTTSRLLEVQGYRVLVADSGAAGIEIVSSQEPIDLVLLDMSMPAMSGQEVLIEMRRLRPEIKVVIFTGYTTADEEVSGADGVVQKPVTMRELLTRIEQILDPD
ncbi:MAG TPA: response regulator [Candidatus Latescibacteria bacterium]|jgi:CheY-like chemotaxis protein|nr:hypothetical protein [Gemmatimonadaceae bacterium]MDP6017172.1 response regulator [Candidatus Latescibacterota bacterium]HJP30932.1 response regulator [Candidatus Latescibacterota bacterium]|tara:strand:- start:390 stop:860 length:471 start_codon:yes stop_codon:yes gene_type:complete